MAERERLLPFAQLDLPGRLAIDDGRYLVRPADDADAEPDVLALRTLGAERSRSRLRRRRPRPVEDGAEAPQLPLARLTLIKAIPFETEAAAKAWLDRIGGDQELTSGLAHEVTGTANRALLAHRVAAPDPYASDLDPATANAVRFGFGTGQEVAEGRWRAAIELPEERRRSLRAEIIDGVGAQGRIAAVLGGRDEVAPYESLLVDAERAAAEGRRALAALTVALALEDLGRSGGDPGEAAAEAGALRERALSGADIDTQNLRSTLRSARRAIRAQLRG